MTDLPYPTCWSGLMSLNFELLTPPWCDCTNMERFYSSAESEHDNHFKVWQSKSHIWKIFNVHVMKKSKTWTWLSCDHPLGLLQVSLTLGLSELTLCANVARWNLLTFYLCVYMYEIAEENSQHLKVTRKTKTNTTHINGVITLWVSLTKYQTITFIMMSWQLPWLPTLTLSAPNGGYR